MRRSRDIYSEKCIYTPDAKIRVNIWNGSKVTAV